MSPRRKKTPRERPPQDVIPPEERAIRSKRAWVFLLSIIVASVVVDLVSKSLAFEHIAPQPVDLSREQILSATGAGPHPDPALNLDALIPAHEPVTVIPRMLELTLVLNPGAVFGIGAGKRWIFVGFTALALTFGFWIFGYKTRAGQWLPHLAIGLLVGGGLGNLYDRLVYACVRDFLHPLPGSRLPFGIRWPNGSNEIWPYVSNIADLLLIIGIGLLMWHIWRSDGAADEKSKIPEATSPSA